MKTLLPLFAAVLAVGCGLPPEAPEAEQSSEALRVKAPSQIERPQKLERVALKPGAFEKVAAPVQLSVTGGAQGDQLQAVFGQMGCGFLELGRDQATLQGNTATLQFSTAEELWGLTVLVFRDVDHDGVCDPAKDQAFMISSYDAPDAPLTLDLSAAARTDWACNFF